MTPKEKANELIDKMTIDFDMCKGQNIECALIAVHEILSLGKKLPLEVLEYYVEVKIEINKL